MEYKSHLRAGAVTSILRRLERIQVLVNDGRVSNCIDSLEPCCNASCVSIATAMGFTQAK